MAVLLLAGCAFFNVLIWGYNTNGILTYDRNLHTEFTSFIEASDNFINVTQIAASEKYCYIVSSGVTYMTGMAYELENVVTKPAPVTASQYLHGQVVVDISTAIAHTIALTEDGRVHTIGNNQYNQLGRNTSQQYSAGPITLPRADAVMQVGAVRNLSYVVYQNAIYVVGKCEYGLCGSGNGSKIDLTLTVWTELNLSTIPSLGIKRVYFGSEQIIIQTDSYQQYYLGNNAEQQGCNNWQTEIYEPWGIQIPNVRMVRANSYVMAGVTNDGRLLYCGCADAIKCGQGHYPQLYERSVPNGIKVIDVSIQFGWLVLGDRGIVRMLENESTWSDVSIPYGHADTEYPNKLAEMAHGVMLYNSFRGLLITADQDCVVSIGNRSVFLQANVSQDIPLNYMEYPAGSSVSVLVSSHGYLRINQTVTIEDGLTNLSYSLVYSQQITIEIEVVDAYNSALQNIQISMTRPSDGHVFFNETVSGGYRLKTTGGMNLKEHYLVTASDVGAAQYFPTRQIITLEDAVNQFTIVLYNVTYYQLYFYGINNQPVSGISVTYTLDSVTNQSNTDVDGAISVPVSRQQVNSGQPLYLEISYGGGPIYKPFIYAQFWYPIYNPSLSFNLAVYTQYQLDLVVDNDVSGTFNVYNKNSSILCASVTMSSQRWYSLNISEYICAANLGNVLEINYTDQTGTYYTANKTTVITWYMQIPFTLQQNDHTVVFQVNDQFGNVVANYDLMVSLDNITFSTVVTDGAGQAQTQIMLSQIQSSPLQGVCIMANAQGEYKALNLTKVPLAELIQTVGVEVYRYSTMVVIIQGYDSVLMQRVSGIAVHVARVSDGLSVYNGTTDSTGAVEFSMQEQLDIIRFNSEYMIAMVDPSGRYKDYQTTFYVTTVTSVVDCLLNAKQLNFLVFDTVNQVPGSGADITIYIDSWNQTRSSNQNGMVQFDVPGDLTNSTLQISVAENDVYKPIPRQSFRYSIQLITVNVEVYLNFSLEVTVHDGKTDQSIDGLTVLISNMAGDLKVNKTTDVAGRFEMVHSEREDIVNTNTVYNMTVIDPFHRYSQFLYNYSVRAPDEKTMVFLNLQELHITVTNIEAMRVPNVRVILYQNGTEIRDALTDPLGSASFYLKESEFIFQNLTYKIMQSDMYRATPNNIQINIRNQPWYVVKIVFPLVVFDYRIKLILATESEEVFVDLDGQPRFIEIEEETLSHDFVLSFLDDSGVELYKMPIDRINKFFEVKFVENINQSFVLNDVYQIKVHDPDGVYKDIVQNFTNSALNREFILTLVSVPPNVYRVPVYGIMMIVLAILGLWFLIYANVQLHQMVRQAKQEAPNNPRQNYLDVVQENLNKILLKQEQVTKFREHISKNNPQTGPVSQYENVELDAKDDASEYFKDVNT